MYCSLSGYGIAQSDDEAIHWWTLAANNGSEAPSVRAMNTLAMVYSRPDSSDMNKVSDNVECVCVHTLNATGVLLALTSSPQWSSRVHGYVKHTCHSSL